MMERKNVLFPWPELALLGRLLLHLRSPFQSTRHVDFVHMAPVLLV